MVTYAVRNIHTLLLLPIVRDPGPEPRHLAPSYREERGSTQYASYTLLYVVDISSIHHWIYLSEMLMSSPACYMVQMFWKLSPPG